MEGENKKKTSLSADENVYAILSYLWILCLVPVLMKKDNEFVKFHAKQGLVLFIVEMAVAIIGIIPLLGTVIYILGMLICGMISLIGIIQVLMGNKWKIPVISEWAEKIEI